MLLGRVGTLPQIDLAAAFDAWITPAGQEIALWFAAENTPRCPVLLSWRKQVMVTAIVLLKVRRNLVNDIAGELSSIEGISEVYSVSGQYDLVAMIRTVDNDAMADVVTRKMLQIEGINSSETMLSFRCYSQHDLEGMFSIGS